jgi:hypothetical protein
MSITKLTTNGLTGSKYDTVSADNYFMEPIATTLVGTATSTVTFSGIPSTYKHLQIRFIAIPTSTAAIYRIRGQFNSDTGNNYATHLLYGGGASAAAAAASTTNQFTAGSSVLGLTTNQVVVGILDIFDYSNTNKYKTARILAGGDFNGSGEVDLNSGLWMNTAAITSISLYFDTTTVATNSRFSLYGIRG